MLYLDHAATTVVRPEAVEAMAPFATDAYGNPSGIHAVSRRAKNAIEIAREELAAALGAPRPLDIVFTGGGTEADNLAVAGTALAGGRRGGVVTSAIEHEAVLETARHLERLGCPVRVVGVDGHGVVDASAVVAAVDGTTRVVSVMLANNETGVLQPVREIADRLRAMSRPVALHTDAVQAFVSEDVTVESTGADLISLAAHKFGGPKGVGALYVRNGVDLEPVVHGGGQEMGRRSGTHNVAGIVGMAAALRATVADREGFRRRVGAARGRFEQELCAYRPDIAITGADRRLVQHSHLRIPGVRSESLLIRLDHAGVAAAAGSACQSGAIEMSHVLEAMGFDEVAAAECVRFSFGWINEEADGADAAKRVIAVLEEMA